ncbi:MAG: transporter substrate-binding domain-containing protein [Alphaproteobacteria bacterium]|nr:transporter substrate-binding domain-containing protein [Alphaproteobacteria bacterium]
MIGRISFLFGAALILGLASTPGRAAEPITVAADVGFVPHIMVKPDGSFEGYNVDLIDEIARRMGRPYKIVDQQWSGIFAGLNAKKYDFIISPTTITEERAKSLLFVEGYIETDYLFVLKKTTPDIAQLEDLKGKVLSVNNGNLYDKWASEREGQYGWTIQRYGKNADAVQAVLAGRAHANLVGNTAALHIAKSNPLLKTSFTVKTGQVFSIPFRKDDVETRNQVEAILECMKLDGTVAKLNQKWFDLASDKDSVSRTVLPGFGQPGFEGHDPTPHTPKCS